MISNYVVTAEYPASRGSFEPFPRRSFLLPLRERVKKLPLLGGYPKEAMGYSMTSRDYGYESC